MTKNAKDTGSAQGLDPNVAAETSLVGNLTHTGSAVTHNFEKPKGLLAKIERVGNMLPNPFWLFVILGVVVLISSWLGSLVGLSAIDPGTDKPITINNLLTAEGLQKMVSGAVKNFTDFPPLGTIITIMLGVAVAEYSGLISAVVRAMVSRVGPKMLTFTVAIAGITGSIASDAIYVILIPLGAMSFRALGRSPIVGAMVAYAASSAGFNASLVLTITDVLLGGISTSAAQIVDKAYAVSPLANYYFVVASSIVLAIIITLVTELYIKRKARELVDHNELDCSSLDFKQETQDDAASFADQSDDSLTQSLTLTRRETRAVKITGLALLALLALYFFLLLAPFSPLHSSESILDSPLITAVAVPISLGFTILGIIYGVAAGTITRAEDVPVFMGKGLATMVPMIVLFFAVSQFLAWFNWSNIGAWTAIKGSELLQQWQLPAFATFLGLVLLVALLDLIITSGSAQWALMAPIIVPMMMYVGVSPEVSQMIFRIGDSPTNIVTPMSPYFALMLMFLQRYYKKAGVGTLMSLSLPYTLTMLGGWFLFFLAWYYIGLPLGPGTPMTYTP